MNEQRLQCNEVLSSLDTSQNLTNRVLHKRSEKINVAALTDEGTQADQESGGAGGGHMLSFQTWTKICTRLQTVVSLASSNKTGN